MTDNYIAEFKELKFIGLDTHYPCANGKELRRIHLDGAASPLACKTALDTIEKLLPHYSNTHSHVHTSAKICTQALNWAHDRVLEILNADSSNYTAIFTGSGTTAGINRLAAGLNSSRPEKPITLVSSMEHHANDLPHRKYSTVKHIPLCGSSSTQGCIDLEALEALLIEHRGQVNYIAISAVSNVTGIINPIEKIARLVHQYDALLIVDAAQLIAHKAVYISQKNKLDEADFWVFSGHKVYTPTAPGVVVAKRALLQAMPQHNLGGGSVSHVSYHDHEPLTEFPDRELSGTPNIVGAIALVNVMSKLEQLGYDKIEQHSRDLTNYAIEQLSQLEKVKIYGDLDANRIAVIAINHQRLDHGLLAAILNDYYGIAVRNECFCAHPYVSSLLKEELWELDLSTVPETEEQAYINLKRGMVRISLSLYNTRQDIDYLVASIIEIEGKIEKFKSLYKDLPNGDYVHKSFSTNWMDFIQLS